MRPSPPWFVSLFIALFLKLWTKMGICERMGLSALESMYDDIRKTLTHSRLVSVDGCTSEDALHDAFLDAWAEGESEAGGTVLKSKYTKRRRTQYRNARRKRTYIDGYDLQTEETESFTL